MKKSQFLEELKEVLDLEELTNNSSLHISSVDILSLIAFFDENFDKQFSAAEFRKIDSVSAMVELLNVEFDPE